MKRDLLNLELRLLGKDSENNFGENGGGRIQNKKEPHPNDLVDVKGIDKDYRLHKEAKDAYDRMIIEARNDGIDSPLLLLTSGYRSYQKQKELFAQAVKEHGNEKAASRYVAKPGSSAHHTGRAIDLKMDMIVKNISNNAKIGAFNNLQSYKWLKLNASRFGFYPYLNEPWHWEYNPIKNYSKKIPFDGNLFKSGNVISDFLKRTNATIQTYKYISEGITDPNLLTNKVYYSLFPHLKDVLIKKGSREADIWIYIKNRIVFPILRSDKNTYVTKQETTQLIENLNDQEVKSGLKNAENITGILSSELKVIAAIESKGDKNIGGNKFGYWGIMQIGKSAVQDINANLGVNLSWNSVQTNVSDNILAGAYYIKLCRKRMKNTPHTMLNTYLAHQQGVSGLFLQKKQIKIKLIIYQKNL
jgi:hypothetical protein